MEKTALGTGEMPTSHSKSGAAGSGDSSSAMCGQRAKPQVRTRIRIGINYIAAHSFSSTRLLRFAGLNPRGAGTEIKITVRTLSSKGTVPRAEAQPPPKPARRCAVKPHLPVNQSCSGRGILMSGQNQTAKSSQIECQSDDRAGHVSRHIAPRPP